MRVRGGINEPLSSSHITTRSRVGPRSMRKLTMSLNDQELLRGQGERGCVREAEQRERWAFGVLGALMRAWTQKWAEGSSHVVRCVLGLTVCSDRV